MGFVDRLNTLLREREVTAYILAKEAEFSESLVSKWKKDTETRPSTEVAIKIADYFDVSLDWLLRGLGEKRRTTDGSYSNLNNFNEDELTLIENFRTLPEKEKDRTLGNIEAKAEIYSESIVTPKKPAKTQPKSKQTSPIKTHKEEYADELYISMPVFEEKAAAGVGSTFGDYLEHEEIQFRATDVHPKADAGIRISGDSMTPEIQDGSIVWVKWQPEVGDGQIGIFALDKKPYCKKIKNFYDKNGRRIRGQLISLNLHYEPIDVDKYSDFRTVGLVLGSYKPE